MGSSSLDMRKLVPYRVLNILSLLTISMQGIIPAAWSIGEVLSQPGVFEHLQSMVAWIVPAQQAHRSLF